MPSALSVGPLVSERTTIITSTARSRCNGATLLQAPPFATMAMPTARIARSGHLQRPRCADAVLPFLAPSIRLPKKVPGVSAAQFSTSPALQKRDNNRNRGLSIFRATGTRKRQTLSVKKHLDDLPAPEKPNAPVHGDPNHGLYGFFRDKKLLRTPVEDNQKGTLCTDPAASMLASFLRIHGYNCSIGGPRN